ncbi:methyltransferase domain-containing protein [Candidatus Woesearchaeota archaeon]|nr:methyltransferase domain-containing protein [Candidatus Woesearchaeota archaeon]
MISHLQRLQKYYRTSKYGYSFLLWGSKHFGFYPIDKNIPESEAQKLMQDLIAKKLKITNKDIVLDAGCGRGVVSTYLAKRYKCSVKGIDLIEFELKMADSLARELNVSKSVEFYSMDYSNMKFKNNSFDCLYTMETLSHSINIRKTLRELYRVLKKNGRIALFEYTIADDKEFSSYEMKMLETVAYSSAMDGLKSFRHNQFQNILKEVGFKNIKVEDITGNTAPSIYRLRRYLILPYYLFVKPFSLQKRYPNATAAIEFTKMGEKGLVRYNVFTATK